MADPALTVASDTICHILVKAREFDAQDVETDTDLASNGSDDRMIASLEDHVGDPNEAELRAFIDALDDDGQILRSAVRARMSSSAGSDQPA